MAMKRDVILFFKDGLRERKEETAEQFAVNNEAVLPETEDLLQRKNWKFAREKAGGMLGNADRI